MAQVIVCDHCGTQIDDSKRFEVTFVTMTSIRNMEFCSIKCAIEWLCIEEATFNRHG